MKLFVSFFLGSLVFGQLIRLFIDLPIYLHDLFLVFLLLFACFLALKKKFFVFPDLITAIAGFIFIALISLAANYNHVSQQTLTHGLCYLGRWTIYSLLYAVVVQRLVKVNFWLNGLYAIGTGFAVLGLFQFIFYPSLANLRYLGWDPYYYRLFSTLLDPSFTGLLLGLTFLLGLSFRKSKTLIVFELINALALFLTFSRSSLLAFLAGLFVYGWFSKNLKPALIFITVVAIFIISPKPGFESFRLTRQVSSWARIGNWQQSLVLFREKPLIGHGFNLLIKAAKGTASKAGAGIDNSWLFILDTTGVIGLVVFVWLGLSIFKLGVALFHKKNNRTLGIIFFASFVSVAIHSLFNNSLFYPWIMIWLWVLIGVAEISVRS